MKDVGEMGMSPGASKTPPEEMSKISNRYLFQNCYFNIILRLYNVISDLSLESPVKGMDVDEASPSSVLNKTFDVDMR